MAEKSPRNYKCNFHKIFNHKYNVTSHPLHRQAGGMGMNYKKKLSNIIK